MPRMKPPHYENVSYDGRKLVPPNGEVDVRDTDIQALKLEGWLLVDLSQMPVSDVFTDEESK